MAGIGRTGTLMGTINTMMQIKDQQRNGEEEPEVSIFATIRRLREQRFNMCETPKQYVLIHNLIKHMI